MASEHGGVERYEILHEIGHGGAAVVYLARQTDLGRLVALKELSALQASEPSAARRFVRESRLAAALNHPNIVTVHDFFESRGTPYIAMEYLERGSLRPLMRGLRLPQIVGVLEGLLAGLGHAQEHHVVHRDLKPENVMVTRDGRVKIADFGIAKATGETLMSTQLTADGTAIGTPAYMAPEQALGEEIGPWTDLYALGVIAFELFAGCPPFGTSDTPAAVLLRHVNETPPELVSVDPTIDPRLSAWVDGLLVKEPEDRTQTAAAAWLALEEIVLPELGARWRRSRALPAPHRAAVTPETMAMAYVPDARRERSDAATPRRLATTLMPAGVGAAAAAAPAGASPPRGPRKSSAARLVARSALLLLALVAAAFAATSGGGSREPEPPAAASPAAARQATPTTTPAAAAPSATSSAAPRRASTAAPAPPGTAPRGTAPRGDVGDERSDDPSDDEPDVGEP